MAIQLSTNQFYTSNQRNMQMLGATADKLQTQVSTGKKLLAPSDDAVGYRRLQGLIRDGSNDKAYAGNITIVSSALSQADTTLKSITDEIQRAKELAVKANSGTLSPADRSVIADELDSINKTLVTLANAKDSRGASIFGPGDSPAVVAASDGTFSIATDGPTLVPIGDSSSVVPGEAASRLFVDSSGGNIFASISALSAALRGTGDISTIAGTTGTALDASNTQVAGVQGSLGARAQRVDVESSRMTDVANDREITRSSIEDVDPYQAITDLQKTMTILSAAQASFTKLAGLSLFDYMR
jgi:flagellar hook-associated protein 3 FlgL